MNARVGYDIGNRACLGEWGCGLEEMGLVGPLGDVALDEFDASRLYYQSWLSQYAGWAVYALIEFFL